MSRTLSHKKVSTFEAKTHLSNLIAEVEHGTSILITKRGKTVAKLVPYQNEEIVENFSEIVNSFRNLRARVKGKASIQELKEAGRKR